MFIPFANYLKKYIFWKSKNRKMMFRINSIWLKSDFWSISCFFYCHYRGSEESPLETTPWIVNFVLTNNIGSIIPQLRCFGSYCLAQWRQTYLRSESRLLRNSADNGSKQYWDLLFKKNRWFDVCLLFQHLHSQKMNMLY